MAVDERTALAISLSPGQAHDGVEGRKLLKRLGCQEERRHLAWDLGHIPVVPPRRHRRVRWE